MTRLVGSFPSAGTRPTELSVRSEDCGCGPQYDRFDRLQHHADHHVHPSRHALGRAVPLLRRRQTVDQMPLERFYGPAVLVDLAPGSYLPAKTPITVEMLAAHEAKFQPAAKLIYRTGWDRAFGTPECFSDFPTLTLDAARWIAERRIGLLGMDTLTPSVAWKEVHDILLAKGVEIVIVEGLSESRQAARAIHAGGVSVEHQGPRRIADPRRGDCRLDGIGRHCRLAQQCERARVYKPPVAPAPVAIVD